MCTNIVLVLLLVTVVLGYPSYYETHKFKVGIEYAHSLPMNGGSDRFRHRHNYDPFFVTVTASAKLLNLYQAQVRSCMEYCSHLWDGSAKYQLETLEAIERRAKRLINDDDLQGYVLSYLEVTTTVDKTGEVQFHMIQGQTGTRNMVFQLISNNSEFLSYSYLAYGIREEEYKKVANIVTLPNNKSGSQQYNRVLIFMLTLAVLY